MYEKARDKLLSRLKARKPSLLEIDGVRLSLDDGSWILVRPSGTEPKLRIYAQSRTPKGLKDLLSLAYECVKGAVDEVGARITSIEEQLSLAKPP